MQKVHVKIMFIGLVFWQSQTLAIEEVDVDVELQLLLDISGSVNSSEYQLQLDGYVNAFASNQVQNVIQAGQLGRIAVQLIMWSGQSQQQVMIDWALVNSPDSADNFASQIASLSRPFAGWTAIGSAIDYGLLEFTDNGFAGQAQVMDISGDGKNNQGIDVDIASDNALVNGVDTINGIVITTRNSVIEQYVDDVAGGDKAFVITADTFADFEGALSKKLMAEIARKIPAQAIAVDGPPVGLIFLAAFVFLIFRKNYSH